MCPSSHLHFASLAFCLLAGILGISLKIRVIDSAQNSGAGIGAMLRHIMYNKGDCTYCTVSMRSKEEMLLPLVQHQSNVGDAESQLTQGRLTQHIQDQQHGCQCTWCVQGPTRGQDWIFEEGNRPESLD